MKSSRIIAAFIFLLVAFFIVSTWFRNGILYGGAEIGLFSVNPERWLEMSKYIWWDAVAPGQLVPQFIVGVPLYSFFYVLQLAGLSPQNIQQLFFTLMFFLMGFGIYLLSFDVFDVSRKKYAYVAALFYLFNAYILVQVWHRFLYSTILLAAILPILILFWRRWICKGSFLDLTIFILINGLSVYMYGSLASVVTIWTALVMITLAEIFFLWKGKNDTKKIILRFVLGFGFWLFTNIWWLIPTFSIAPGLLPEQHTMEDDLTTLIAISRQSIMPYLLQLTNPFYLFVNQELGPIYSSFLFKLIPWIMSGLIFWGLIIGLKMKDYARYSVIFLIAIILAKGAAPPFPIPFIFGFTHFFVLGVIRNPFEKLGILLPIFGALLFAIGLQAFLIVVKRYFGSTGSRLVMIIVILALIGYAWPLFSGSIFGTKQYPLQVKVPASYTDANNWLKSQRVDQGIILHLPFAGKDVVTYDWDYGYHGVDQNNILFTSLPSLSRVIGIKRVDETLSSLTSIFHTPSSADRDQVLRALQMFNVKFVILHKDTKWEDNVTYGDNSELLDPVKVENDLDHLDFLIKEKQFDSLVIYRLKDETYKPSIFLVNNAQLVYPGNAPVMQILSETKEKGEMLTPITEKPDDSVFRLIAQISIFPEKRIDYFESSPGAMLAKASALFERLVQIANYFNSVGDLPSLEAAQKLIESTQKISQLTVPGQIAVYENSIVDFFHIYNKDLNVNNIFSADIKSILELHTVILRQAGDTKISGFIEDNMVNLDFIPQYRTYGQTYKFQIPLGGQYALISTQTDRQPGFKLNGTDVLSRNIDIQTKGSYEINYATGSGVLNGDIFLKKEGAGASDSGKILVNFKKKSPVSYSGMLSLDKPGFLFLAEAYHPGWQLTLFKDGQPYKENNHYMGNLYENAWLINKIGDYSFVLEFIPQGTVKTGIIISAAAVFLLMFINLYRYLIGKKQK